MRETSQSCTLYYGKTGATIYLKRRVAAALKEVFLPSSIAQFDYKAMFDAEGKILTIKMDTDVPFVVTSLLEQVARIEDEANQ